MKTLTGLVSCCYLLGLSFADEMSTVINSESVCFIPKYFVGSFDFDNKSLIAGNIPLDATWDRMGLHCWMDGWWCDVSNHDVFSNIWTLFIEFHTCVHITWQVSKLFHSSPFLSFFFRQRLKQKSTIRLLFFLSLRYIETFFFMHQNIHIVRTTRQRHELIERVNVSSTIKISLLFFTHHSAHENSIELPYCSPPWHVLLWITTKFNSMFVDCWTSIEWKYSFLFKALLVKRIGLPRDWSSGLQLYSCKHFNNVIEIDTIC